MIPKELEPLKAIAREFDTFTEFEQAITIEHKECNGRVARYAPAWDFQLGKTKKAKKLFEAVQEWSRHEILLRNGKKLIQDAQKEYVRLKDAIKKINKKDALSQLYFAAYYGGEHGPSPEIGNASRDAAHKLYAEIVEFIDLETFWRVSKQN